MKRTILTLALATTLSSGIIADEPVAPPNQEALEKAFVENLTGANMIGQFTIVDQPTDPGPRPDKYTITKVEKKDGNNWLIIARVEYERGSFPVALKLPVEWAGSTPVITVTNLEIPVVGAGVFNARVLIDGDRYAGTWSHDTVGGHMFGRISKPTPPKK
jgi:hypothetical protein